MKKIGIVMGSDSDLPIVEKGITVLQELEIPFEVEEGPERRGGFS